MNRKIGFVLLTHDRQARALRLVNTLDRMFDAPPIAWHHDSSKSELDWSKVPSFVRPVLPAVKTAWGDFGVVMATLIALEELFDDPANSPDWFYLLSGACYPIQSADQIYREIENFNADGAIRFHPIHPKSFTRDWDRNCFNRYRTKKVTIPWISRKLRRTKKTFTLTSPPFGWPIFPYRKNVQCYAGDTWFAGSRKMALEILRLAKAHRNLAEHYSSVRCTDESYFQTLLVNFSSLKLKNQTMHYIDWSRGGANPKTLTRDDLEPMLASGQHFARKFDERVDGLVQDELDRRIFAEEWARIGIDMPVRRDSTEHATIRRTVEAGSDR